MGNLLNRIMNELCAVLDSGAAGAGASGDPASFELAVELAAESFTTREKVLGADEALRDGEYGLASALAEVILAGNPCHSCACETARILAEACEADSAWDDEIDRTEEDDALLIQDILYKTEIPEAVANILESFFGNMLLDVSRGRITPFDGYLGILVKLGFVRLTKSGPALTGSGRAAFRRLRPDLPEHAE